MKVKLKENWLLVSEISILTLLLAVFALWLFKHVGFPQTYDELLYLNIGLNTEPAAHVLNRYFHIYLQKIFIPLAKYPVEAARFYWTFVITATIAGVYIAARLIYRNIMLALLAISVFLAQTFIFERAGTTWVDFTLMLMLMVMVLISLMYLRTKNSAWLFLFGLILYLSFRTKEPGFAGIALIPVFTIQAIIERKYKTVGKSLVTILCGILVGLFLFFVSDGILLGDPFFSVRPSSWRELVTTRGGTLTPSVVSYIDYLLVDVQMYVPFLLYLSSFTNLKIKLEEKFIWSFPIAFIGFLTLLMIMSRASFQDRYLIPIYPLIALFSVHPIASQLNEKRRPRLWETELIRLVVLMICVIAVNFFLPQDMDWSAEIGGENIPFQFIVLYPVAFVLLLVWKTFLNKPWNRLDTIREGLGIMLLMVILNGFIIHNMIGLLNSYEIKDVTSQRFLPLMVFADDISCSKEDKIMLSKKAIDTVEDTRTIRPYRAAYLLNLTIGCNYNSENFVFMDLEYLENTSKNEWPGYTYILVSFGEWKKIKSASPDWLEDYSMETSELVLLSKAK